ncbi:MAG: hypothetical protein IJH04_07200 [Eggerthellaceae bacterium]|nr:hypothetical protein [Eggerthellaceae bacterium]
MMNELGNRFSDPNLTCNFPARTSFREALLDRLLAQNEQLASSSAAAIGEVDPEARELADDELELLAAAMGDYFAPEDRRF